MDRREALETGFVFGGGLISGGVVIGVLDRIFLSQRAYDAGKEEGREEGYRRGTFAAGGVEPTASDEEVHNFSEVTQIEGDDHLNIQLNLNRQTLINYAVFIRERAEADIFLFEREEYNTYTGGGDPDFLVRGSNLDTSRAFVEYVVQEGEFNFVIDNTDVGRTGSAGQIEADYALRTYQDLDEEG